MKIKRPALIIDDARFMRKLIREALSEFFNDIYELGDPKFLKEYIIKGRPLLITVDLSLDSRIALQGLDVIDSIIALDPQSLIVVISAINQEHITKRTFEKGAKKFVHKPFDNENLRMEIKSILEENHVYS